MGKKLKKPAEKKSKTTPPATVQPVRQLIINEMPDGQIVLQHPGMNLLELLGWIPLKVKPDDFIRGIQVQIEGGPKAKKG